MRLAILFLLLLPLATACERTFEVRPGYLLRQYSISTTSPTAAVLRSDASLRDRLAPLLELTRQLFHTVDERIRTSNSRACNLSKNEWTWAAFQSVMSRQIGVYDNVCDSRIDANEGIASKEFPPEFVDDAWRTIREGQDALYDALSSIKDLPDRRNRALNWTMGAVPLHKHDFSHLGQQCTMRSSFAYRVDGKIYLSASVTNEPVDALVADPERQFVQEFIAENFSTSLPFCHPKYDGSVRTSLEGVENVTSTTLLTVFGGKASLASHGPMDFDTNPAIVEAMRLNEIVIDQAEDAVQGSNVAILALPMVMSLIPVAFLADLNTCATLWYIVFTDIFSVLPFLIKGIELVQSAEVKRSELVAFHVGNSTLGEMEVWAAECSGDDNFRVLGIAFVVIAVAAMFLGVLLEMAADIFMKRNRANLGHDAEGLFGRAAFDTTAYSILGSADDEEKERRYSTEEEEIFALDELRAEKGIFLRFRGQKTAQKTTDGKDDQEKEREISSSTEKSLKRQSKVSEEDIPGVGSDGMTGAERTETADRLRIASFPRGRSENISSGSESRTPPEPGA